MSKIEFGKIYNARKGAEERENGKFFTLKCDEDGMHCYVPVSEKRNLLCNIMEGFADVIREELNLPNITFHDIQKYVDEDDEGNTYLPYGENCFAVWNGNGYDKFQAEDWLVEAISSDVKKAETVIVTRHKGAVEYLKSKGFEGRVVEHFDGEVDKGETYIGVLPLPMIKNILDNGAEFILLTLPGIAFSDRGQELSPEEMENAGATLHKIKSIEMEKI